MTTPARPGAGCCTPPTAARPGRASPVSTTAWPPRCTSATPANGWVGGLNGVYATTDGGSTWQRVAAGEGVEAIAATDPAARLGLRRRLPARHARRRRRRHRRSGDARHAQRLGVARQAGDHRLLGQRHRRRGPCLHADQPRRRRPGRPAPTITVPAYGDHHFDGVHTILYRSTDNAGNQEQTESLERRHRHARARPARCRARAWSTPASAAPCTSWRPTSPVASAGDDQIVGAHGRVLSGSSSAPATGSMSPAPPYYWIALQVHAQARHVPRRGARHRLGRQPAGHGRPRHAARGAQRGARLHGAVVAGSGLVGSFSTRLQPRPASCLAAAPARQPDDRARARPARRLEGAALGRDRRTPVAARERAGSDTPQATAAHLRCAAVARPLGGRRCALDYSKGRRRRLISRRRRTPSRRRCPNEVAGYADDLR